MKQFSHTTSQEVKRIRIRLNKEFSEQQAKYSQEHEDLVTQIEDLQDKLELIQKEISSKQLKRNIPDIQKRMLENQIRKANSKK